MNSNASILFFTSTMASVGYGFVLYLRRYPAVNRAFIQAFGPLLREKEIKGAIPGAFWMLLASLILFFVFPLDIACLALSYVSIGDPIASLTGLLFGTKQNQIPVLMNMLVFRHLMKHSAGKMYYL